jgi:Fe-S-cluster containining protein
MADDPLTRGDLDDALRFLHAMASQGERELDRIDAILAALVKTLLASGVLDRARVEALLPDANARLAARAAADVTVDIGPALDKYAVSGPTDLDCAALLPLCRGRCCRLTFALSFQDLDEGQVRWDYRHPYRIRQGADSYCVHSDPATRGCGVYAARPATCRRYDCRNDARIWDDFARRIPAPIEKLDRLVQIRPRPEAPPADEARMEPRDDDDSTP